MIDFPAIVLQCGPDVFTDTLQRIVSVESSFNPYAIGVVGGRLERQPKNKNEAVATANYLANNGWNFSMGLAQINRYNLPKYGLDYDSVFEPCLNLRAAASIYNECFVRANKLSDVSTARLQAFSCYYSGNFTRGFMADASGSSSYVERIANVKIPDGKDGNVLPIPVISTGAKGSTPSTYSSASGKVSAASSDPEQRRYNKINSKNNSAGGIKQLRGE
ncbi:lytic transglycosylase domain-containing protein [Enterobacter sp.]|uniref:lytic transglycosylase domain-containing protein n=3 Tax=Enterobacter sp. TaxID=42895 RepID=UPI00296F8DAC|nr:lytic transglycosylase domain-containing protein [Enterobacter sp.]